jgi:glutamyl-tRNA synthetase
MLRFALSPYVEPDIADLRKALVNYVVARQRGEGFILRFEESEKGREEDRREEASQRLLERFAISPDQVLHQRERRSHHQQLAVRLLESGKAFLCICSEEELEKKRRQSGHTGYSGRCATLPPEELRRIREEKVPFTLRIRKPAAPLLFRDLVRGEQRFAPAEVDHFVLLRADGTPTPVFADACDDMMSGVTLLVRPEEELLETARELHVHRTLGYETLPECAHLPPLLDEAGRRLGRHHRGPTLRQLLEEGFLPDAVVNYLLRLGNDTPVEIFTLPEAIEWFDLRRLSPDPLPFEMEELRRINREHLRRMDDIALSRIFGFADADIGRLAKLHLEEAATLNELDERIRAIFAPKRCEGKEAEAMRTLSARILEAPMFGNYQEFLRYLEEKTGLSGEHLSALLRRLMTGADTGPELEKIFPLINPYLTEVARCQP